MKQFLCILAMIFLTSCAVNNTKEASFPVMSDAKGTVIYGGKTYYVVTPSMLTKVRKKVVTYVGSTDKYHLFREWLKVLERSDEIYLFALEKCECVVEGEKTPEEEERMHAGWRHVDITNGGCLVRKR